MGANAQTSVPLFVANAILTASQQNISAATGVPVFATTVTRDAAFGGSNKVLAEGQLAYIEASDIVQYYTGSAWATLAPTSAGVVQVKNAFTAASFSTASTSYVDITGMSIAITPTSASNKVLVTGSINLGGAASEQVMCQLMRDTTAVGNGTIGTTYNAITVNPFQSGSGMFTLPFMFLDSPATTSATTYKLRMLTSAGTSYMNRRATDSAFGGSSTITVMEVTP